MGVAVTRMRRGLAVRILILLTAPLLVFSIAGAIAPVPAVAAPQGILRPVILGLSPDRGPVSGGTLVVITGENLTGVTKVTFGNPKQVGTDLVVVSDNELQVVTPASRRATDVSVQVAVGTLKSPRTTAAVFTYSDADTTPPGVPTGLTAVPGDTAVTLTWAPVTAADLAGYRVSQASAPEGPYLPVTSELTSRPSLMVDGLTPGTLLWFRVTAVDTSGNESGPSVPAAAVPGVGAQAASSTALAFPGEDLTVAAGDFIVRVPAGSVSDPAGVALTVTPLIPLDGVVPRVDVHVHGPWDPTAGGVTITAPWPYGPDEAWQPLVFHDAQDGLRFSAGDAVAVDRVAEKATYTLHSLSTSETAAVNCDAPIWGVDEYMACERPPLPWEDQEFQPWLNDYARRTMTERLPQRFTQVTPCPATGTAIGIGKFGTGIACQTTVNGNTATWAFENTTDYNIGITPLLEIAKGGVVYTTNVTNAGGSTSGVPSSTLTPDYPALARFFAESLSGSLLFPGETLKIDKTLDSGETEIVLAPSVPQTLFWQALVEVLDLAPGVSDETQIAALGTQCLTETVLSESLVDCAQTVIQELVERDIETSIVATLGKAVAAKLLAAASFADAFGSVSAAAVLDGLDMEAYLRNYTPTNVPDNRGGTDFIARDPSSGRAVQVLDGVVYDIPNQDTLLRCAQTRLVWDIGSLDPLNRQPQANQPAPCDNTARTTWDGPFPVGWTRGW